MKEMPFIGMLEKLTYIVKGNTKDFENMNFLRI